MKASVDKNVSGTCLQCLLADVKEYPLLLDANAFKHAQMTSVIEEDADWLKNR